MERVSVMRSQRVICFFVTRYIQWVKRDPSIQDPEDMTINEFINMNPGAC